MIVRTSPAAPHAPPKGGTGCVAVTGGGGFLGRALVTELLTAGFAVRGLARSDDTARYLAQAGAQVVRGGLDDRAALATLCRRVSTVVHAAALVDVSAGRREHQHETVDGTVRLLRAAFDGGARRFVYISSAAVYGATDGDALCSARSPIRPAKYNHYSLAKLAAENEVRERCRLTAMDWNILRLPFLVGPGDSTLVRTLAPLLRKNRVFVIRPGTNRIALVDVRDAARVVRLALVQPAPSEVIFDIGGDDAVTQRRFLDAHADALGLPRPRRVVRRWIARRFARLFETGAWVLRRRVMFNRATVDLFSADQAIDSTLARDTLSWIPQYSFEQSMDDLERWLHEQADSRHNAPVRASIEVG